MPCNQALNRTTSFLSSSTILNTVQERASPQLSDLFCFFLLFFVFFFLGGGEVTNCSFTILFNRLFYYNGKRVLPWFCPESFLNLFDSAFHSRQLLRENMHLFLFVFAFLCPPFPWQTLTTVSVCSFDFCILRFSSRHDYSSKLARFDDRLQYQSRSQSFVLSALVFRPLVKGNEALGTRLLPDYQALSPLSFTLRDWSETKTFPPG